MPEKQKIKARCPECEASIYFDERPELGQQVTCPECETGLEVIGNSPVKLGWVDDEDDWDDDEFDLEFDLTEETAYFDEYDEDFDEDLDEENR